ncbi:capsid protein of prophage [Escherichia coli]|uniref:Capsid protein of prophage n=1 Tax=Escherichia coli TaxID=562 RepID=A0A376MW87_ECOLX|nr:capsid protein of prophage [Escherichia coli]
MRIEAGLSTYEKELALMGEIIRHFPPAGQGICRAGKSRTLTSVWIAQAYQQQIAASRRPEEETTPRET